MSFFKSKTYKMNIDRADSTLQNIFAACNQSPNTIPFDKLVLRQQLNTRRYNGILCTIMLFLVLTFSAPLFVVPAAKLIQDRFYAPVKVVNDYRSGDTLYLELSNNNVLYKEAYLQTTDGRVEYAISYDSQTCTIAFPYIDDAESNIYIPVKQGDTLHLLLTPDGSL